MPKKVVKVAENHADEAFYNGGPAPAPAPKDYGPGPHTAVDAVVIFSDDFEDHILVITRKDGTTALPGGFVDPEDDSLLAAILREVKEETGLDLLQYWRQEPIELPSMTDKKRDPRSWVISHPFFFKVRSRVLPKVTGMDDAIGARWVVDNLIDHQNWFLDHRQIIRNAFEA